MKLPTISLIAILTAIAVAALASSALQAGSIKKWVDEDGVTHYGTAVPPEYVDKEHVELNERGIELKRHDRAPTAEEIEQQEALAELRAEQQKLLEEQQARDRILLNLYRNEDDLIMARDGKIAQIDSQNQVTHKEIRRLKARLSEFQAAAANAERTGRTLNPKQQANLERTRRSIERSYAMILAREDEKQATIERYNYDLQRFRTLRKGSRPAENTEVAKSAIPDLVETAVRCEDPAQCDQLWRKAQDYAREHATTPIDLAADRILVTAPPREKHDLSVTVSRLADEKHGGERIFMDLQCVRFSEGQEFCRGPEVAAIREQFRSALDD
jgi:hypothetical protein